MAEGGRPLMGAKLTLEQRGSILMAIDLLARALAFDDAEAARLALVQLQATLPPVARLRRAGRATGAPG